ncbi:hypothetical protein IGS68_22565 [Skermanella sp. TT6]|uniref:Rubredoxin-like domain-containing protein n=1 Tax=Skermanella cutis TaxID=2775420 RepID=A0ABX7B352_9PROT|nr:hypothetical protein [Skermanella sp. TT6]QQP88768.1 hypothetical protein IGS68_22565 [Skermanella sp. TT6]
MEKPVIDAHDVKCGFCSALLEPSTDPKFKNGYACPVCGNADEFDNILAVVGEYVEDRTADKVLRQMSDTLACGNLFKVTPKPVPKKVYRFVIDL